MGRAIKIGPKLPIWTNYEPQKQVFWLLIISLITCYALTGRPKCIPNAYPCCIWLKRQRSLILRFDKLVPSAIPIHSYLYWIDIELMNKWHWTSPRQIKVEKTVIYSFSLFENAVNMNQYFSVSECLYVCLLSSVFMCFCVSSFHV